MEELIDAVDQELAPPYRSEVYSVLVKVLGNIVQNPGELKYRTLKKDNKLVAEKLCRSPAVVSLLLALGFEDEGAGYRFAPSAGVEALSEVVDLLLCIQASRGEELPTAGAPATGANGTAPSPTTGTAGAAKPSPAAPGFSRRADAEKQRDGQASQLEAIRAAAKVQHAERPVLPPPASSPAHSPATSPQADGGAGDKRKTPKSAFDFESRSRKESESQKATQGLEELRRQQKEKFKEFQKDPDAHKSEAYQRPASVANGGQADQSWGDWFGGFFGGGSASSGGGGGGKPSPPGDRRGGPKIKGIGDLPKPVQRG